MKVILVSYRNEQLAYAWQQLFDASTSVSVVKTDICTVDCDAVVSPAKSFGFMDGGLDHALTVRFGNQIQDRVRQQIRTKRLKELLVGEAIVVPTNDPNVPWLISAPTMRVPGHVWKTANAYLAM